ncbi:MAG: hypothetical protein GX783_09665 [Clostridiales bacterium]|nr:hypothetical protein [Clostridiales bacterium]
MNYDDWGMTPAQDFMVPVEYHDRYGHMYQSMEPCINNGMVQTIMYPDIYYRIYPYVQRTCDRMDNPYMHYPSEAQVESMVDDCYDTCIMGMPDLEHYADLRTNEVDTKQIRRRPLLRDLIAIILITELFRRRENPYGYGSEYRPGYGYAVDTGNIHDYYPGYDTGLYPEYGSGYLGY